MTGIRVYEFAKEHKLSSKEMLTVAKNNGIEFSSHMSMMNQEQQAALNNILAKKNEQAAKPKKQENSDKPTEHRHEKAEKPAKQGKKPKHLRNDEDEVEEIAPKKSAKHHKQAKSLVEEHSENGDDRGRRGRRNRRNRDKKNQQPVSKGITARKHKDLPEKLVYTEGMNIQDIAKLIHRDASEIIKKLLMLGVMANQNQALSKEVIELIAMEYGIEPEEKIVVDTSDLEIYFQNESATDEEKSTRPPVVTIMGHVDHGKTTLLDQLRNSRVTEGEAGGITQHIGAYQVDIEGKTITFLDTPGHEAFTTMRARGADVTDITIIVVAADDGVMPQTVEAINHAKAADVPIIVAVNKIDKPAANPDRVMQEMTEHGLIPEAWGGETIFVPISAKFNQNIEELLEMILLVAEVQELKANANRLAIGTVIEARLDKAQGSTATLLVQEGTLNVGDPIVVGNTFGKVRTMVNDQGRRIRHAGPATPVEITGLNDAPQAGDLFVVFADEKSARAAGEERAKRAQVELRESKKKVTLDNLFESLQEGELKSVNVIIKGDVQGSVEALSASLQKIEVEGVRVNTIHQAVGAINESDVSLAAASGAIVIGFNVRPTPQARAQAEQDEIDIRLHRIIYNVIDEIETAMKGMLDPEYVEEITGQVVVRETYTVSKLGTIAGSYVLDGMIQRNSKVRIIRDNIVIYDGELASLKRFKDDAKEVTKGFECGIMIENYNDIKVDDIIEPYRMVEVKRV
ncbi:translation initiation factor IF-2 [Aerococcaceae bacterium zg-ZUI334]|uniref:translation initiation factor IF-2 n=1 Tax=Aerococcaceae bacterium zg-252 TaxID=2796928 RepID=UPI001B9802BB|nr:translation initiation factor IF-2 [Aerococcaceae bacterium zg-ZUI334]